MRAQISLQDSNFISLRHILRSVIAALYGSFTLIFWGTCTLFSKVTVPVYNFYVFFKKCLFKSSAHFLDGLFDYLLLSFSFFFFFLLVYNII